MASLPEFKLAGDLPTGLHPASLDEVVERFGGASSRRRAVAERLRRLYELAAGTGHLARFVIFGSFVTAQPTPNDVEVSLLMDDEFDAGALTGEAAVLFDHPAAQTYFGASVFWLRRRAALGGEQAAVEHWQIERDGSERRIVEVVSA